MAQFHDTDGQCQPEKQKEEEMAMIQDSEEEAGGCVGWRRTTACYQCFALINGANDRMDRVAAVLDRLGRFNEGDEFLLTVFFDVVTTRLDEDGSGNEGEEVPSVEELVLLLLWKK